MIPKTIVSVKKLPLLGTGKIDYVSAQALAPNMPVSGTAPACILQAFGHKPRRYACRGL